MKQLDAVNYLLGILGSSPVGSLDNKNPDVTTATDALDAAVSSVTGMGFWFNKVYNIEFSPDPLDNHINTAGYTKLITHSAFAVVRGEVLFDPINNTYAFEKSVFADAVEILDFELLPDSVQEAVQYFAGMQLASVELEDQGKVTEQRGFYASAFAQVKAEDLEITRRNILTTPRVSQALHRVQPYRGGVSRTNPNIPGGGR